MIMRRARLLGGLLLITVRAQDQSSNLWKNCDPNGQRACCISNCKCLYEDDQTINKIECTDKKLRVIQQPSQPASIKEYDLSRNNIESIPRDTFKGMLSLETLNISRNSLSSLDPGSFSGLSQTLRVLDLSSNNFQQLPTRAFKAVLGLTKLYVSRNQVKKLGPLEFAPLGNLSLIDISFNPGVEVSDDAFRQLDNLRDLVFKNCKLTKIPDFTDARREIRRLNLAGNNLVKITTTNFKNMRLLETLILRNNAITSIDQGSFEGLEALKVLDLSNNQLTTLPEGLIFYTNVLQKLYLTGMKWNCDCDIWWLTELFSKRPDLLESADSKPKCAQPIKWLNYPLDKLNDKYSGAWCKTRKFFVNKFARTGVEGSDIQLECKSLRSQSNAQQNGQIKWFGPDGKDITLQSQNYKTRVQVSGSTLKIKSLRIDDSGTWTCYNEDTDYVADTEFTVTPASGGPTTLFSTSTIRAVESVTSGPNAVLNTEQSAPAASPSIVKAAAENSEAKTSSSDSTSTGEPLRRTRLVISLFIGLTVVCAIVLIVFYKKRRRKSHRNDWETRKLRPEEQNGNAGGRVSGQQLTRSSISSHRKTDEQIRPLRQSPPIDPEDALGTPIGPPETISKSRIESSGAGTLPSQKTRSKADIAEDRRENRKFHSQPGTLGRNGRVKDIVHHLESNPPRCVTNPSSPVKTTPNGVATLGNHSQSHHVYRTRTLSKSEMEQNLTFLPQSIEKLPLQETAI
ncbi:Oidioi.mRNA.OKI2018_I69.PAR.g9980.t1.cds [Oikopleura dioica]|uniref:Oidioi.mRNA.OKI2018_I69.PAR.g9980.t1.cds n=1 Tax=Oikopleura dioica TaxID=34765 RepID=A0ABN7RTL3_OIKDI|nr:Oidioi.mRNA.OKI2018_I69.PAR.g9980.t1.cds [Oikopleura dioica]